jgi:hypothetical protein
MLKNQELLDLVKAMPNASKSELVRAAGYFSMKKDGTERLNFTAFYDSLLQAKGVVFGETAKPPGRSLSYVASVQFNGNLMVGKSYISQLGAEPGDQYKVVISRANGTIRLVPVCDEDAEDIDDAGDTAGRSLMEGCAVPATAPALVAA